MSLSNEEQLSVALRAQSSRDEDPDVAERICEEIRQSTIFRHNWQALLQSAPVAISATGALDDQCSRAQKMDAFARGRPGSTTGVSTYGLTAAKIDKMY
jgi:hypothetical protein